MKITFDVPDGTKCAFLNFVFYDGHGMSMNMGVKKADSDDLYDGATLEYDPYKED